MLDEPTEEARLITRSDSAGSQPATDPFVAARRAIMREEWAAGVEAFEAVVATGVAASAPDRLLFEIARIRLADDAAVAVTALPPLLIREADGEIATRRYLVSPLIRSGNHQAAAVALEKLLEAYPQLIDARRNLVSSLAKLERWDEAISHMDMAAASAPDDLSMQAGRVQFRLLARQTEAATEIALQLKSRLSPTSPEAHVIITALLRGGRVSDAADIASMMDPAQFPTPHVAASATQALLMAGLTDRAITAGEAAITGGHDTGALRAHIGEAILQRGRPQDIATSAIEHLSAGLAMSPDDKRVNALYGEALLRTNRSEEAVVFLEKANAAETKSPKTRGLYARALRAVGRHSESADQYMQLLERAPNSWPAHRQAAGVLNQAGRREEATKLFYDMVARRAAALPGKFEEALADLADKVDQASVPQARLDWAWSLRIGEDDVDRAEWERRAKWGMLSDLLIIDWLECRENQAEEAMGLMSNLDRADEMFAPMREKGQGFIIATAHLGPLFSGPILLELCSLPSRWVASTPSVADTHYAASVISTSDQTETQVAKAVLKSLQNGYAVGIAVDGSGRLGSPTIRFEGQDITYSNFAARAAHRAKVPSLFYAARWEDGRIAYTFEELPFPEPGEEVGPFSNRWRDAYLANLRTQLGGLPENLRLAGGLWSCIRPPA
jgi:tetratricopeptide (TPR) repeat protein